MFLLIVVSQLIILLLDNGENHWGKVNLNMSFYNSGQFMARTVENFKLD